MYLNKLIMKQFFSTMSSEICAGYIPKISFEFFSVKEITLGKPLKSTT